MIRVAGYCRVSTEKDDQANSFETQQRYFREYIRQHPDWSLYEIYADEGITGTSTKKRTQFNRMINDAYAGKFHLILTKEVSRFSRNILDTIRYTRELKAIGIGVLFVTDRINTLEPEAEMLLSFLASLAQEESRRTSGRVVWGQTRQMEQGVVFGQSMLGYDVRDGTITPEPHGAGIVRLIFQKYAVEQAATSEIARYLTTEGFRTQKGGTIWSAGSVLRILRNEKYIGDLVQKKTYTPDFLTHEKRKNTGQVPLIRIENHHEPIISRELWNMAQARLQKNNKHADGGNGRSNRYVFSGKIRCGQCGSPFVSRLKKKKDGSSTRWWRCGTAVSRGADACDIGMLIRDDDAMQMLKTAIGSLNMDRKVIADNVMSLAQAAVDAGTVCRNDDPARLRCELERIQQKKEAAMDSFFSGDISKEELVSMKKKYEQQMDNLRERLENCNQNQQKTINQKSELRTAVAALLEGELESDVFSKTILDGLTVFRDRRIELRLRDLPQVFLFLG